MDISGAMYTWLASVLIFVTRIRESTGNAVALNSDNINSILASNELVFVNFYADWCRFSQILKPVFDETAQKVKSNFPEEGKVVLGKVDCDKENAIAAKYHVNKYPTLKVFRNGQLVKREYRGQRSVDSLSTFVAEQLKDPVNKVPHMDSLDSMDRKKRNVIGYFDSEESDDYRNFAKVAKVLKEDCIFHAAIGEMSQQERIGGNRIAFRPTNLDASDVPYSGNVRDYNYLHQWSLDKCVPLVREITFENAEELTEEGLPFVILFHNPTDTETPEKYRNLVSRELLGEKTGVNFLTADGLKFSHPLYHLGKSSNDLPVLAIDSFRHMYIFPHDVKSKLEAPGLVKQFIADLHSGKLHREFHHGPDPAIAAQADGQPGSVDKAVGRPQDHSNHGHVDIQQKVIMTGDGVRMQVVRVVSFGGSRGTDNLPEQIKNQIRMIESAVLGDMANEDAEGDGKAEKNVKDDDEGTDEEDEEKDNEKEDKEKVEEGKKEDEEIDRDMNPRGKVLLEDTDKKGNEEIKEESEQEMKKEEVVKEETSFELKLGKAESNSRIVAKNTDSVGENVISFEQKDESQKQPEEEPTVKVKVLDVKAATSKEVENDDDYDIVHSKTKRIKIEGIPNQAKQRNPPKSIFRHLGPSEQRYTILEKDEL